MSKPVFENLVVGTYGWQTPVVSSEFYPEDLPAEWQLDYYSNFSNLVVVPQEYWMSQLRVEEEDGAEEFEESEELREAFVDALLDESQVFLVLDCTENTGVDQVAYTHLCQILDSLDEELSIVGVLFRVQDQVSESRLTEILSEFVNTYQTYTNLYLSLILPAGINLAVHQNDLSQLATQFDSQFELSAENSNESLCIGDPVLWIEQLSTDGKQQAQILKTFVDNLPAGKEGAPIVVAGSQNHSSIQMASVQNLKVVSELMGY